MIPKSEERRYWNPVRLSDYGGKKTRHCFGFGIVALEELGD